MAKSLDQLLDFLLEEIALSGERGLGLADLAGAVDRFYGHDVSLDASHENNSQTSHSNQVYIVDLPFLEKIWKWLGRHQDVSIGKNHIHDHTSLITLEKQFPGLLSPYSRHAGPRTVTNSLQSETGILATEPNANESDSDEANPSSRRPRTAPRVYVTETRMFIAICGHPPDPTRVFQMEWQLLSYIAAARHEGILQGDLVRLSGQDKRSVPKRTDALQVKGYIDKQKAYIKGNKTSRLILRRYIANKSSSAAAGSGFPVQKVSVPTIRYQCLQVFDVLKRSGQIMPKDDLATAMNMTTTGRLGVLNQIIQHFSHVGCVKRTKTAFGPSAQSSDLKLCIQWIREPVDTDWLVSDDTSLDFTKSIEELSGEPDDSPIQTNNVGNSNIHAAMDSSEEMLSVVTRPIPQWSPDRVLTNVLFDVTNKHGKTGLSNTNARKNITGIFVRRLLESLLMKTSHHSLQSQPIGLKHLSIIRSRRVVNGTIVFLHFVHSRFEEIVADGYLTWANAEGGTKYLENMATSIAEGILGENGVILQDQSGFPFRARPDLQIQDGKISLTDLIRKFPVDDIDVGPREPILRRTSTGRLQLAMAESSRVGSSRPKNKVKGPAPPVNKRISARKDGTTGRPRKFMRGTEKFWRDMFLLAKRERTPGFRKAGTTGLMDDPAGLRMFNAKPPDFDETLVEAISARLPIPRVPSEINQGWIDTTLALLDPPHDGLFFSQSGHIDNRRNTQSKVMVLKSPTIRRIDFNNRKKIWQWQMISSSASHSFRYQRFYPRLGETPDEVVNTLRYPRQQRTPKNTSRKKAKSFDLVDATERSTMTPSNDKNATAKGPLRGVFYEDDAPTTIQPMPTLAQPSKSRTIVGSRRILDDADTTESDTDLPPTSTRANRLESVESPQETPSPAVRKLRKHISRSENLQDPFRGLQNETQLALLDKFEPRKDVAETPHDGGTAYSTFMQSAMEFLQQSEQNSNVTRNNEPSLESVQHSMVLDKGNSYSLDLIPKIMDNAVNTNIDTQNEQEEHPSIASVVPTTPELLIGSNGDVNKRQESANTSEQIAISLPDQGTAQQSSMSMQVEHESDVTFTHIDSEANGRENATQAANQPEDSLVILGSNSIGAYSISEDEGALPQFATPRSNIQPNDYPASNQSRERSRALTGDVSDDLDSVPHSNSKGRGEATRGDITKVCRKILLELLNLCSGVAPCEPSTFRRAIGAKWRESGIRCEPPTARVVRTNLNSICQGTKFKRLVFAFQTKAGAMDRKQIIALSKFDITSPEVIKIQEKIKEAEPADYIPPELEIEARRVPFEIKHSQLNLEEEDNTDSDVINPTRPKPKTPLRKPRKRKEVSEARESSIPSSLEPPSLNNGFLTLKIKNLHTLRLTTQHTSRYQPPTAEQIKAYEAASRQEQLVPSTRRSNRMSRPGPVTRNITWKKSRQDVLPDSLDNVPNIDLCREEVAMMHIVDSKYALFEAEVDCVEAWEAKNAELFDQPREQLKFINHRIESDALKGICFPSTTKFESLVQFDLDGHETETAIPEYRSWTPFRIALEKTRNPPSTSPSITSFSDTPIRRTRTKRKARDDGDHGPQPKRRKQNQKARPARARRRPVDEDNENLTRFRRQRTQVVRHISPDMRYRVIVSVIIVRTLAGGIEKYINWTIISRLFPDHDQDYIRSIWKSLYFKYRTDVSRLTENLQERYLEALSDGQVPTVEFDNLAASNWEAIFEWALINLDKFIVNKIDDLPDTREQFDLSNKFTLNEHYGMREILSYGAQATQPRKEEVVSSVIFGESVEDAKTSLMSSHLFTGLSERETFDPTLARAKSWVMATVLTLDSDFHPLLAHRKLQSLAETKAACEQLLAHAVKSLQRDKLIVRYSKAQLRANTVLDDKQVFAVRIWEASDKFYEIFRNRQQITTAMLRTAANYKFDVIDRALASKQSLVLDKDLFLDDGIMIAILNLFAMGMIRICPGSDKPDTRYGLDWENRGYLTKLIDKKAIGFSVVITPIPEIYQFGDIFIDQRKKISIPRGEIDRPDGKGIIPLWYDISHFFRPDIWEMVVGAVAGLISIRPGIDNKELYRTFNHMVTQPDLGMILTYLEELGAIKRTMGGKGWETKEWWWMCLGPTPAQTKQIDQESQTGQVEEDDPADHMITGMTTQ